MTNKPIKDLTPEERTAFIQEMKQSLTPEEWDNITTFAAMMNKAGDWWNSDDVKDTRADIGNAIQTASVLIRGLSQFLPVFLEEIEKDAEAGAMTMTDFIESGKCDELVDRATAKLEPGPDQYSLFTDEDKPQALSLQKDFIPILDGALSKDIMRMSTKSAKMDSFTKIATIRQSNSSSIIIEKFDEMQGALSTSAKKLFDVSLAGLGAMNYYRSSSKQPFLSVEIPLIEYGEANGYQLTPRTMGTQEEQEAEQRRVDERIRELKRSIKRDLNDLSKISWTGTETKGKNKGDFLSMRIISSGSVLRGIITVNFDVEAARYFVNAYVMRWPTVLLKHDNRNPNAYVIGRKIAYHNGNDQNAAAGTNCTLSVSSLLAAAPEIQTIEELKARGQRNWKDKIKKPLESALNDNVSIGLLEKWEYRDPGTGTTYTPETAQALTWVKYEHLMIDFIMQTSDPAQEERRAAKEAAKAAAAAEQQAAEQQPTPKRKRGRPRKEKPAEK